MKKIWMLFLLLSCVATGLKAQGDGDTKLNVGAELMFPSGSLSTTHSMGIGGSVQLEHFFQNKLSGLAYFGYQNYFGKSVGNGTNFKFSNYNVIPVRLGARYYLGDALHAGAQMGIGFVGASGSSNMALAYSLQLGYNFNTKKGRAVDMAIKYDGFARSGGSINSFGIRVGYNLLDLKF